jgi:hypothetical protein
MEIVIFRAIKDVLIGFSSLFIILSNSELKRERAKKLARPDIQFNGRFLLRAIIINSAIVVVEMIEIL